MTGPLCVPAADLTEAGIEEATREIVALHYAGLCQKAVVGRCACNTKVLTLARQKTALHATNRVLGMTVTDPERR